MVEVDVRRHWHRELRSGAVLLLAWMIAETLVASTAPMSFEWHGLMGGGAVVDVLDDSAWLPGFLLPMAAGAIAVLAWTIAVERRVPGFGGHRDPDVGYRQLLVGLAILGMVILWIAAEGVFSIVMPDRYWIRDDVMVDVRGAPAHTAAEMVKFMVVMSLGLMAVPLIARVLERLDPSRPVAWIKTPATAPAAKEPDPAT